ncbi:anti-sigma factor [bacterium]|nr:anti-sigma factor [bacterium]
MKKEEFISSGLLELYVLGSISNEELSLVNDMLAQYPELNTEVERIESDLIKLAESQSPKPSAKLKTSLLDAIDVIEDSQEKKGEKKTKVIEIQTSEKGKSSITMLLMVAASLALLIVSAFFNYIQYQEIQLAKQTIASLNQEKEVLANDLSTYKTSIESAENKIVVLRDTANVTIPMKGLDISPNSLALIHWNKYTNETFIDIASLPEAPTDMQYQLWAIVDGVPVDLGVFDVLKSAAALQKMKTVGNPQAFAVTLEKSGGSPTPTMENMYVLGAV